MHTSRAKIVVKPSCFVYSAAMVEPTMAPTCAQTFRFLTVVSAAFGMVEFTVC